MIKASNTSAPKTVLASLIFLLFTLNAHSQQTDCLNACWSKQVKPLQQQWLSFSFTETINQFEHSFKPWQATTYAVKGLVSLNTDSFSKTDTLGSGKRIMFSKTRLNPASLLLLDYGEDSLAAPTEKALQEALIQTARYSPVLLINYFFELHIPAQKETLSTNLKPLAIYKTTVGHTIVTLYIRKADQLISHITTLSDDELFGDVLTTFLYTGYTRLSKLSYPDSIHIQKINGKLRDEVAISGASFVTKAQQIFAAGSGLGFLKEKPNHPELSSEKYDDHIHFINLKHTDDKVLLVEFNDFLVVEGAPLNSENGELIRSEAKRIAPGKPIKYFLFGHYHPHYLGGMRPFIHAGATVVTCKTDEDYVRYLAAAPHRLNPDSLQLQPEALKLEEIKESKTIADANYEMRIYFIGDKSTHTNDYMIYYFPAEKLLFEDDLVWISQTGIIQKAGARQAGLYHAIIDLGLDVTTIVQSWPVAAMGVKTIIPFTDLEQSMKIN